MHVSALRGRPRAPRRARMGARTGQRRSRSAPAQARRHDAVELHRADTGLHVGQLHHRAVQGRRRGARLVRRRRAAGPGGLAPRSRVREEHVLLRAARQGAGVAGARQGVPQPAPRSRQHAVRPARARRGRSGLLRAGEVALGNGGCVVHGVVSAWGRRGVSGDQRGSSGVIDVRVASARPARRAGRSRPPAACGRPSG